MRLKLISFAGAAFAFVLASPAAAQWAPHPDDYGPPAYGYGYETAGFLQERLERIRGQIARLDQEQRINRWQTRRLFAQTRELDLRVRKETYERDGRDLQQLEGRIEGLERQVRLAASYDNGGYGNGYNGYYQRRDRDDRWGERGGDADGD